MKANNQLSVERIDRQTAASMILNIHYARRMPVATDYFGLYIDAVLVGVCSFGPPGSHPLRVGICGEEFSQYVIELNRLVLITSSKNAASFFVSRCIKMLQKPKIIVSYADTSMGHIGTIYQACNFLYTGLSAKRTDWKVKGMEDKHGISIADEFKGKNRVEKMREKYGEKFYIEERARKHRYIFVHSSKSFKKNALKNLNYKIEDYPKGESKRYCTSFTPTQLRLL